MKNFLIATILCLAIVAIMAKNCTEHKTKEECKSPCKWETGGAGATTAAPGDGEAGKEPASARKRRHNLLNRVERSAAGHCINGAMANQMSWKTMVFIIPAITFKFMM